MSYIIMFLFIIFLTFIPMYIISYIIPLKKENLGLQTGFRYIVKKYNLSMDKRRVRLLSKILIFVNSFILSIPILMVVSLDIKRWILFVISFFIFVIGIIGFYNLVGFILKKKGW